MRAIAIFSFALFFAAGLWSCGESTTFGLTQQEIDQKIIEDYLAERQVTDFKKTESGIFYHVLKPGSGQLLPLDSVVSLGYEGRLPYGYIFDSSFLRGDTFMIQNGTGRTVSQFASTSCDTIKPSNVVKCDTCPVFSGSVIAGWVEAVKLMRSGERTRFYIPSHLGYGGRGSGSIPGNSVLIFDIEAYKYVGIADSCKVN